MNSKKSPDIWLFGLTLALLVIGLFLVFDASYARAGQVKYTGGDSLFFLKRQAVYAVIGLLCMFAMMRMRYWKLEGLARIMLLISIIGLALVLVPGIGVMSNGARRWIALGPLTLQPSEFAKLGLIVYLAALLASKRQDMRDLSNGLVPALLPLLPIGLLIMAEPDMGTMIVLTGAALSMIYIAGARNRHMTVILAVGLILGTILVFSADYRRERVMSFVDPFKVYHGSGYQVCQSLIALGAGGPFGVGICEGREKLFYLPAEHTDFIFAVLGEEMGLIGTLGLISLFIWLGIRGFTIACKTKDDFGRFLAAGITCLVCGQALLNMLVVTSSVPATGVPLPFISYGGSSLITNLVCIGVLLGISKYPGPIENYEHENRTNRGRNGGARISGNRRRPGSTSKRSRRTTR